MIVSARARWLGSRWQRADQHSGCRTQRQVCAEVDCHRGFERRSSGQWSATAPSRWKPDRLTGPDTESISRRSSSSRYDRNTKVPIPTSARPVPDSNPNFGQASRKWPSAYSDRRWITARTGAFARRARMSSAINPSLADSVAGSYPRPVNQSSPTSARISVSCSAWPSLIA